MEEALRIDGFGCRLRVIIITEHHVGTAADYFANPVLVLVDHLYLNSGQRQAGRAIVEIYIPVESQDGRAFR